VLVIPTYFLAFFCPEVDIFVDTNELKLSWTGAGKSAGWFMDLCLDKDL
jgi:hypothetical protein